MIKMENDMAKSIIDWFNPSDPAHMRIWITMEKTGVFSRDNVPDGIEFPINWQIMIVAKIARAWTNLYTVNEHTNTEK